MRVTPKDIVLLALKNNRTINAAHLDRETQKFDLKVAEDKFNPDLTIETGPEYSAERDDLSRSSVVGVSITPTVTLKIPTGGQFQYSWANSINEEMVSSSSAPTTFDTSMSLSITQPLLKGGGVDVNTASINIAQIEEEINKSILKETLIDTITSAILSYRTLLQAHRQIEINELSLQRAKDLLN
tara:strand:- start:500 stop:1054 length:555 start_codon:yes stop_codon:yes gene_type:complete